jgi:hypothetical protein
MRRLSASASAAFALLIAGASLQAQTNTAQITGLVQDAQGGVVPDASVTITQSETGAVRKTNSNDLGYYSLALLQPGTYQIEVQKTGFRPVVRTGIVLTVGQSARLDLSLEVGSVSEAVTVSAGVPLLETTRAESGAVITTRQFDQMPLLQQGRMRNPASFIYLTPRVQGNVSANGTDYVGATNEIHTGGGRGSETEVSVDGLVAGRTELSGSFTEVAPPVDSVQEFRVTTSLMSAEFGHSGPAQVSFQLKSGTNDLHGSVFEYFRNDKLDARSWLSATRTTTRQNEFGATIGGPVRIPKLYNGKDRTFFFFSYAGSRKRGATSNQVIQIATPQNVLGDFSNIRDNRGALRVIYDPTTTRQDASGAFVRDPFPGNIIPANRIDPVARKIAGYLPAPNTTGGLNYMGLIGEKILDPDAFVVKGDHSFNDRQKITMSLNTTNIPRLRIDSALPDPLAPGLDQVIKGYTARLSYDYVIRPNLLNQLSLGYNLFNHRAYNVTQRVVPGDWPAAVGLTGVPGTSFPVINFTDGYASFSTTGGTADDEQVYALRDSVSWFHGKHSLKFGTELRSTRPSIRSSSNNNGTFSFNSLSTALPLQAASTGNGFASFLLGQVYSATQNFPSSRHPRRPYAGFYVQDDYKVTRRLTLNLGFRYEFTKATTDSADMASAIYPGVPNPGAGGRPGALVFAGTGPGRIGRRSFVDTDWSGIGPRFGMAFQADRKTVIRAGYGVYYSNNYLTYGNAGFAVTASFQSLDTGLTPAFVLANGFPQNFRQTAAIDPTFLNGRDASIVEQGSAAMPRTQNWSFSIQRELSANMVLELTYRGTRGTRQTAVQLVNLNQVDPKYLSLGSVLQQNVTSPAAAAAGIQVPYPGFTGTVAQALRPFPQYLNVTSVAAKAGNSAYNGATVSLRKRFSIGLSFEANYTWSKAMGYTEYNAPSNGTDVLGLDNYNRGLEYGLLPYDSPHQFLATWSYALPFGPDRRMLTHGWLSKVLGDWNVSGVHRYQSGTPLRVTMTNTLPIFNRIQRPDIVSGQGLTTDLSNGDFNPYADRHINGSAFATPRPFTLGNAAPSYGGLRTFAVLGEDFSVIKGIRISERFRLETYGQFFNAFNRHRFAQFETNYSSANFGRAQSVSLPRYIQLGLRVRF